MNNPISFTPADITALCNLILVVAAVVALIFNGIKKAKAPNERQDKRIDDIEKRIGDISTNIAKIQGKLDNDKRRLDEMESGSRVTNRVIIQTLQALVKHGIDGNNKQELIDVDKKLNHYLLNERLGADETN